MKREMLLAVALVAVGCGPAQSTSVPVKGSDVSVLLLAGKWVGSYEGLESGRKGVIHFDLSRGSTYAEGKVIMSADDPAKATSVPIKFVEAAEKGMVKGVVGPYTEPQLKVQVETEFIGARRGDVISGTFTTRAVGTAGQGQTGTWKVTKQR
ncbi:MAG: hypothetical protein HY906_06825 [Deltaproteobacteria bacterium]|nr:hypothetical protein [Deltaproteobacteria bacterium]